MRAAFSNCPVQKDKTEMQNNNLESSEEGLAFLHGQDHKQHQIIYASTTQPHYMTSRKRTRLCNAQVICAILIASVLATGLIALEMYRSAEILRLREDTDKLRADFETLKHQLLEDDLLEEIRAFEQQSYKEDEAAASASSTSHLTADEKSSVVDDFGDDDSDDEYDDDNYDDEDEEEEDDDDDQNDETQTRRRRDVELQPPVVARRPLLLGRTEDGVPVLSHSYAAIKELNRTGALTSLRLYDTLAKVDDSSTTTEDPIKPHHRISPLWVPNKWKKQLGGSDKTPYYKRRPTSVTSAPVPIIRRHSRVMQTEGESVSTTFAKESVPVVAPQELKAPHGEIVMRVIQPNSAEQAPQAREMHPGTFVRPHLRSNDPSNPTGDTVKPRRDGRRRKVRPGMRNHGRPAGLEFEGNPGPNRLAAHFTANSTMYNLGHPHFTGNGRVRHPGVFSDWSPSPWMRELGMDHHFVLNEGVLTVRQNGLYYFYSQIYYIDDHDTNGYNVYVNDAVRFQCTTMTHTSSAVTKINTCYTGGVMFLRQGDTIYLRDIAGMRYSLFEPDKSFFGLFRLADTRIR